MPVHAVITSLGAPAAGPETASTPVSTQNRLPATITATAGLPDLPVLLTVLDGRLTHRDASL
ncbi:hypothetical protein ACWENQ_05255 [Nonomuraea sp. NPDC004354]